MIFTWLPGKSVSKRKNRGNRQNDRARLRMEPLEDRLQPSMSPWAMPFVSNFGNLAFLGPRGSSHVSQTSGSSTSTAAAGTVSLQVRPGNSVSGQLIELRAVVAGDSAPTRARSFSTTFTTAAAARRSIRTDQRGGWCRRFCREHPGRRHQRDYGELHAGQHRRHRQRQHLFLGHGERCGGAHSHHRDGLREPGRAEQ